MRVAIHRNLRTGRWVVSSTKLTRNGERKDKKLRDVESITISNCTLHVGAESTRQRIIKNSKDPSSKAGREVYAYVMGDLEGDFFNENLGAHFSFNPFKSNDFYMVNGGQVHTNAMTFGGSESKCA